MSSDITQETEWDSLVSGKKLVAADFWAPLVRLKPIFESIASKYPNIRLIRINVDEQGGLASKYEILGIPVVKCYQAVILYFLVSESRI